MSTEHIAGQQGSSSGIPGDTALLLVGIGPLVYDLLDFHEQLRRDDLQFGDTGSRRECRFALLQMSNASRWE